MSKKELTYSIYLLAAIVLVVLVDLFGPRHPDFTLDFSSKKHIPYGCSALKELMPDYFTPVDVSKLPLYNFEKQNNLSPYNFIIVTSNFTPDELDIGALLDMAARGNSIFIAALNFNERFLDTLHVSQEYSYRLKNVVAQDTTITTIKNSKGSVQQFTIKRYANYVSFITDSASMADTLGINGYGFPDFIKLDYGQGHILLNTHPLLFTNYYFLKDSLYQYAEKAYSYLPHKQTIWDEYYKPNNVTTERSPMRYVLKTPPLRAAWYLLLLALTVYFLFDSRRKQRKVPVVEPPKNASLKYAQTLGQLYYQHKNNLDIAQRKMSHFTTFLNQHFFIQQHLTGDELYEAIANKTGVQQELIKEVYQNYLWFNGQNSLSDELLKKWVGQVNKIYNELN